MDLACLINLIKSSFSPEIREYSVKEPYLDCVLEKEDVSRCASLVRDFFGDALKGFDRPVQIPFSLRTVVNQLGGIRKDQCLFLKREGSVFFVAMFWPWQSDPGRVTLKIGPYAIKRRVIKKGLWIPRRQR